MTLVSLRVRDLATIADVTLELGAGLNVLTGETGAGKSMLVDALALLLGDRADRAAIRPGATKAIIEGVIDAPPERTRQLLDDAGIDCDELLIVRREVTAEGRSRAWVNGSPATVSLLASVGGTLVDLHGQHQTIQLLDAVVQRTLLDAFAQADDAGAAVVSAHAIMMGLRDEHDALARRRNEVQRRADWLGHVVSEIDEARIHPEQDEGMERDLLRLGQASALSDHASRIVDALDDDETGARAALARADRALAALERIDPPGVGWRELLDSAFGALDELARNATEYRGALAEDPERLAALERRRDRLDELRRKHGATLDEVIATRDRAARELELLDTAELDLATIASRIVAAERTLVTASDALTALRRSGGERMAREMNRLLPRLGLAGGTFAVELVPLAAPVAHGQEDVMFAVALNRGMDPRPLARVASGGELSRLMLALKVVLARQDAVPTLVFDEVDQGVGGEVGGRIAEALAQVADRHQVLIITHLPQIAARADRHLRIAKANRGGVATSDAAVLHGEDRVLELARMLGDSDSEAARRMAQSLLAASG